MEERNAKVYSDEQLASELKNKRAAGGGAKALSIAGVILVVAGLMTTLISVAIFGVILCLIGALVMNSHEKSMKQQIGDQLVRGLLESVFEEVDYQPTGHISGSVMDAAVLPVEFHTVEGSHDVKAVYKGMHIEMSGVTVTGTIWNMEKCLTKQTVHCSRLGMSGCMWAGTVWTIPTPVCVPTKQEPGMLRKEKYNLIIPVWSVRERTTGRTGTM